MHELYDLGYQEHKNFHLLESAIKEIRAVLVDIRFSPRARNPQYNQSFLVKTFGSRYIHLKEFGNKNYTGGPIEFVDFDKGVIELLNLLEFKPCILMCGCWNRRTCHRYTIAHWLEEKNGIPSIPFTPALATEIVNANAPKQLDLFGKET